jgi:hypothetical protein
MNNIVSILLPTRKRFDLMLKSVKSLYDKATFPEKIELLLWFDDDDLESISRIKEVEKITTNYQFLIGDRELGYSSLHKFVNSLCKISTGRYLLLWNDDALMMNSSWDEVLTLYDGKTVCIQIDNNHYPHIFPIISRDIYEVLGHFSLNAHNDTWMHEVCKSSGIEVIGEDIYAIHDRYDITGNNDDEVFRNGGGLHYDDIYGHGADYGSKANTAMEQERDTSKIYHSKANQKLVKRDIEKIKAYLESKQ